MSNKLFIYQESTLEFLTVAVQTCLLLENVMEHSKEDFVDKMVKMLPLLYLKTSLLTKPEPLLDGEPQQFVTEDDYQMIYAGVSTLLGDDNSYLEVFLADMRYSDEPLTAFISEDLADIYQELKNLAANYQTENEEVMNDALLACLEAFEEHWGQKLVNVLRPLHALSIDLRSHEGE